VLVEPSLRQVGSRCSVNNSYRRALTRYVSSAPVSAPAGAASACALGLLWANCRLLIEITN